MLFTCWLNWLACLGVLTFSPTRLALGFLLFGREIVSGSSGIRRGTGSPRRKELRLPQNRTKRIATTLEKRICCGRKRGLIFFPHPLTNRIATTQKSDEKNCDYPGKTDLLRPKKGSNLFFLQASKPQTSKPQSHKASKPQRLKTSKPQSLKISKLQSLKASKPQSLKASKPQSLKASKPQSLKASKPQSL